MVKYTCDICGCNEFISTDPEEHEVCMCGYCGKYYTFDQLFELKINDGPAVTRDFLIKKFGMDIYAGELFDYHRMNETVVVPNVVRKIKNFCFENHPMKKLIIPSGVNEIEYCAFELCENLTEVIIYEGLTAIGDYAFYGCKNLKSIKLPASLRKLGQSAFLKCESLEEIVIPENLKEIERDTFFECKGLKRAVIPDTVDRIQYRAFYNCPQLETISISDRTQRVRDDHGELDIFAFSKLMDNNRCTSCGGRMKGFPFKKCTLCGKDTTPKFLK